MRRPDDDDRRERRGTGRREGRKPSPYRRGDVDDRRERRGSGPPVRRFLNRRCDDDDRVAEKRPHRRRRGHEPTTTTELRACERDEATGGGRRAAGLGLGFTGLVASRQEKERERGRLGVWESGGRVPERVSGGLRFGRQAARVMLTRAGAVPSQYPGQARAGTRATTSAQARHGWRAGLARAHSAPGRAVPVTGQFRAVPRVAQSARSGWTCIPGAGDSAGIWAGLFGPARARYENRSSKHDLAQNNMNRASTAQRRAWVRSQYPARRAPGMARIDGPGLGRHDLIKHNLFNLFNLVRYRLYIVVIF
jgi:hypothetical protein